MIVNTTNFEKEVIQASQEKPVLVDFWAEWCGPCRVLSPLLEKLEKAYNGKWKLVKINTDEEPYLAAQFRVSGIPHCVLFYQGKVVDSFTGALPEAYIRQFLDKHIPSPEKEEIKKNLLSDNIQKKKEAIQKGIKLPNLGQEVAILLFRNLDIYVKEKNLEMILTILNSILKELPFVNSIIEFIKKNKEKQDLWQTLEKLFQLFDETRQRDILSYFFNEFENSKREEFKELLILCFQILGQNHPLSNEYRKKLSRLLF